MKVTITVPLSSLRPMTRGELIEAVRYSFGDYRKCSRLRAAAHADAVLNAVFAMAEAHGLDRDWNSSDFLRALHKLRGDGP